MLTSYVNVESHTRRQWLGKSYVNVVSHHRVIYSCQSCHCTKNVMKRNILRKKTPTSVKWKVKVICVKSQFENVNNRLMSRLESHFNTDSASIVDLDYKLVSLGAYTRRDVIFGMIQANIARFMCNLIDLFCGIQSVAGSMAILPLCVCLICCALIWCTRIRWVFWDVNLSSSS